MPIIPSAPVADVVIERPARARVLEDLSIDYCCGGQRPLDEASRAAGHDPTGVVAALERADAEAAARGETSAAAPVDPSLRALIAEIVGSHHASLRRELPRLAELVAKVEQAHGPNHPELIDVARQFALLREDLEGHLSKEEDDLFPVIEALESGRDTASSATATIAELEHEHDGAGEALRNLRAWTGDYTPPADACPTYHALLAGLADLERDLHEHIHKENNILHPRAAALECSLRGDAPRS